MKELPKAYDPSLVEEKWYKFWEANGLFSPDPNSTAEPFVIVIPPPNITGSLHIGHALDNSLQDVLIRYKRMRGFNTLWIPGTDHAGIATQNVVERELKKDKQKKEDLGREKFVEKVWEWKAEYGGRITRQLRRLGASCDWIRERFTMDEGLSKAVTEEFVSLYNAGLIYRGKRIINWCPRCMTALSDIETEHQDKNGSLWHIKYFIEGTENFIVVATTRPETMLGDTAVAVNPKDDRYKHLIGKNLILPLVGRKIPIIADDYVDSSFGTGAVKVTPAHDPNDYDMGERHNLPKINILTKDGKITLLEIAESERGEISTLDGLDRFKGREELVKLLEEKGFLEKIEDYQNSVGHCYRCKTVIEPYLSDQWFIKIKPLAERGIKAVEDSEIKFIPDRWTKVYLQWMVNLKDWCISRQLWWGHRIPVWYCKECGKIIVSKTAPTHCPKCSSTNLEQDPDVFDTWFSSALWPFSTLGWPDKTADLAKFYPTSVLVTGYDIITFWVSRMIMTGLYFMKEAPFKTVFIHGLIRDITGKKMSKSTGNVIDPLDVINKSGADSLRFALISLVTGGGQDIKLAEEKITEARNFANKIWNVSRFVMMSSPDVVGTRLIAPLQPDATWQLSDRWILSRYNSVVKQLTDNLDSFDIGDGARLLYDFIWSEFCDWYIEISKIRLYGEDQEAKANVQSILIHILIGILKLLHPFIPFETEEIYQMINGRENPEPKESIMVQSWPVFDSSLISEPVEKEMGQVIELVRGVRNIRSAFNIPNNAVVKIYIKESLGADLISYIQTLGKVEVVAKDLLPEKYSKDTVTVNISGIEIGVPLIGLIDFEKEIGRFKKEHNKLKMIIEGGEKRLHDENFLKHATEGLLQKEKEKIEENKARVVTLESYISALS